MVGGYFIFVENKTIKFKRKYVEDIKNTIVAFANCDGGTLYIGVNDDGTACGIDDVDDTMLRVTNAVKDAVRPDITMKVFDFHSMDGHAARSLDQHPTFNKVVDFFSKRKVEFGRTQMRSLHLTGEDGMYTNLAFLLSEQCTYMIKLAVFEGSKKSAFRDRRELSGSLLRQLEEAYNYIDCYNCTRAEFSGLDRLDLRDYPPEAVREALLNYRPSGLFF